MKMNEKKVYTAPQISELGSVKSYIQSATTTITTTDADNCTPGLGEICFRVSL
jgi:hypothetical protein